MRGIHRDRWIPCTKGQLRGKCFHLMTSSWFFISQLWCGYNCSKPVFVKKTGVVTFLSISFLVISNLETSHYSDVIMSTMASQITSVFTVCSVFCSGADQRKHQNSASLAYVGGIHRGPMNPPHKGPVTQQIFSYDYVPGDRWILLTWTRNAENFSIWWRNHDPRDPFYKTFMSL